MQLLFTKLFIKNITIIKIKNYQLKIFNFQILRNYIKLLKLKRKVKVKIKHQI